MKRYDVQMVENKTGDYVEISDYTDLEDKISELEQEILSLKDENGNLQDQIADFEKGKS